MLVAMMVVLLGLPTAAMLRNGNFSINAEGDAPPWQPLNVSQPPEYRQAGLADYGITGTIRLGARIARLQAGEGVIQDVLFLTEGFTTWELLVSVGKGLNEPRGTAAFARIEVSDGTTQQQLAMATQPLLLPGSTLRLTLELNLTGTAVLIRVKLSSAIVVGGGVIDFHNVVLQPGAAQTTVSSTTDEGLQTTQESTAEDTASSTSIVQSKITSVPFACLLA
jgi:hypothetical protein